MGLLKMAERYTPARVEEACKKALSYTPSPSYKIVSNIIAVSKDGPSEIDSSKAETSSNSANSLTRGADYYGGNRS